MKYIMNMILTQNLPNFGPAEIRSKSMKTEGNLDLDAFLAEVVVAQNRAFL